MPIYVCHCPDYPNALEKRLAVRDEHLKRASQDKVDGVSRESPRLFSSRTQHELTGRVKRFPPIPSTRSTPFQTV